MKTSADLKQSFLLILILLFCLSANTFSCKTSNKDYCTNPDSVIASEINKKKVVMVGEFTHDDYVWYNALVNVINYWIVECQNDKSQNYILNLVFETDSSSASYINYFVNTGNDSLLRQKIMPFDNLEDCECYYNLRNVKDKIDSLNSKRSNEITINILGFEEYDIETNKDYYGKTQKEAESWFINDRDKNISGRLINFIRNNNENNHYLLEYGDAHLQRGYVRKLSYEDSYGYYLAHYLAEEFGDDNVVSFFQGINNDNVFQGTDFENYKNESVLIPMDKFPFENVKKEKNSSYILRPMHNSNPHYFPLIISKYIAERLNEKIQIYEKLLPGYKANQFYAEYLKILRIITGIEFKNCSMISEWLKSNPNFDWLGRFDSKEFSNIIYHLYIDTTFHNSNLWLLSQFGFPDAKQINFMFDDINWIENWKELSKYAKFINAIGIYWIGYPDEKAEAKKYLVQTSGQDYNEPEKYLQWYRKTIFKDN